MEGLRLTQLSLDQTSQLCKICRYDQWTPPTGDGPVFTVSVAPFWSKILRPWLHRSRHLSFHHNVHSLLWTQDKGEALTLTTHHGAEEEDTESLQGEVCAQSHPDPTSSRSQSQLQDQPVRSIRVPTGSI